MEESLFDCLKRPAGIAVSLLSWLLPILPSALKIPIYRRVFGYSIGRDVRIGISLIRVGKLTVGDHARIGSLTVFRDIPEVRIGSCCVIAGRTQFYSHREFSRSDSISIRRNCPQLIVGEHSFIGGGHLFDIQDSVIIGRFTTVAGTRSTVFTHQLDVASCQHVTKPVSIGDYCMVGSDVKFVPGARVPSYCVVGMGAVVTKRFEDPYCLIAGNPARVVRRLAPDSAYFCRSVGHIPIVGANSGCRRRCEGTVGAGDDCTSEENSQRP